ncbi:MAG: branched-chain amino acid transaminase [Pleomorphochaeta sp.]
MKYDVANRLIWVNDKIINVNDAKINVLSPTSQFGLNVFEGIPCYWNKSKKQLFAFRLNDHYDRLLKSARLIQIECPYTKDEMKKAFIEIITANEYKENISVRQTLFVEGFGSWSSEGPVGMFIAPIPKKNTSVEYNKKGLDICISSWKRISDNILSPKIKSGANYMNSRLGQREAIRNGYDTCLFLNEFGKISEGPGSCFFMVKNNKLITPKITDSVLESITRDTIIQISELLKIKVVERAIDRTEVYDCDEAFLCGSAMGITPIVSIDRYQIQNNNIFNITSILQKEYFKIVYCENDNNPLKWSTAIYG